MINIDKKEALELLKTCYFNAGARGSASKLELKLIRILAKYISYEYFTNYIEKNVVGDHLVSIIEDGIIIIDDQTWEKKL